MSLLSLPSSLSSALPTLSTSSPMEFRKKVSKPTTKTPMTLKAGVDVPKDDDAIVARKNRPENLRELIQGLHEFFASDHVDIDAVKKWMESYEGKKSEWKKFEKIDKYRYTRNLVDEGNGKFNLMILSWGEGMGSSIHDHSDSHCFMKILDGELKETLYDWPEGSEESTESERYEDGDSKMTKRSVTKLPRGSVAYINDSIGLHRVENPSDSSRAVSLHLYSPPFDTCRSFDERSGKTNSVSVTFYSKFGKRTHGHHGNQSGSAKLHPLENN